MKTIVWAGLLLLPAIACSRDKAEEGKDVGQRAADVAFDTAVLKAANAAAGEVVRNAADCDAVKAVLEETNRKLDEASRSVKTVTGRTTLEALKKQVANVAEACP